MNCLEPTGFLLALQVHAQSLVRNREDVALISVRPDLGLTMNVDWGDSAPGQRMRAIEAGAAGSHVASGAATETWLKAGHHD